MGHAQTHKMLHLKIATLGIKCIQHVHTKFKALVMLRNSMERNHKNLAEVYYLN